MSNGFTGNIGQLMPKNWAYEQFVETTQAGIGIDKCMVSIRGTATGPTFLLHMKIQLNQTFHRNLLFSKIYII